MTPKGTDHICPVCETTVFKSNRDLQDGELITVSDFSYHGSTPIITISDLLKCWACGFQSSEKKWEFIRHTRENRE